MLNIFRKAIIAGVLSTACSMPLAYAAEPVVADNTITQTLMQMESPAEDMLDAIDSKNMLKLNDLYHKLETSMAKLNRINATRNTGDDLTRKIGLQNSWFDLISLEWKEMDDLPALANAINQFSGQLVESTHFKQAYRKNIAWMDYLGNEFFLMSKYPTASPDHAALLKARRAELQATWHAVRISIGKRAAGVALIKKVDPVIHALVTESRPARLVVLARQELDLVDKIETYFHID